MSASTILLVDDDEVLSQVLRRVLTQQGYQVVEAGGIAQALEKAGEHPPQLGLFDLRLPDGDGVELARQLDAGGVKFPRILMTAYPLRLRDDPAAAKEFAGVLTKPLNLQELRRAIAAALHPAQGSMPTQSKPVEGAVASGPASHAPEPPMTEPTKPAATTPEPTPASRKRWLRAGFGVGLAAAVLAVLWLAEPVIYRWIKPPTAVAAEDQNSYNQPDAQAKPVRGHPDDMLVAAEAVEKLGVETTAVAPPAEKRPLALNGNLNYDPDYLAGVRTRFPGEVESVASVPRIGREGRTEEAVLSNGDLVSKGQLLAVVWSKDLGEKKSDLVDALVRQRLDEDTLRRYEGLLQSGSISEATARAQANQVSLDQSAVNKAERTLRTWKVTEEEIEAVRREADLIFERKGVRDKRKERDWARVEVRAPLAGTVVEKNFTVGAIVDTSTDLFKVADLTHIAAWANVGEEYLAVLQGMPRPIPWEVHLNAGASGPRLDSPSADRIAPAIDPNQHTALLIGRVENTEERYRVGQFVTATVLLPPPKDTVAVPTSSLYEDGDETSLFVQPDPKEPLFSLRRVAVVQRLSGVVYVSSKLNDAQRKKGVREVLPGDRVVSRGVVELRSAFHEIRGKEKSEK